MRKIVEEDDSLETCSSARSRMDPTDLEEHVENLGRDTPDSRLCCASVSMVLVLQMQLWHLRWLVFVESVDDLRSKVSSKRMSVWLTWSRIV
jgi:xanthine dehydrogenase iron-sulfur cluster and FAD-binding subunit A